MLWSLRPALPVGGAELRLRQELNHNRKRQSQWLRQVGRCWEEGAVSGNGSRQRTCLGRPKPLTLGLQRPWVVGKHLLSLPATLCACSWSNPALKLVDTSPSDHPPGGLRKGSTSLHHPHLITGPLLHPPAPPLHTHTLLASTRPAAAAHASALRGCPRPGSTCGPGASSTNVAWSLLETLL